MPAPRPSPSPQAPDDPYAHHVAGVLRQKGLRVETPPAAHGSYNLVATQGTRRIAVQAKELKTAPSEAKLKQFAGFMASADGQGFHEGWFVAPHSPSTGARRFVNDNPQARITAWACGPHFIGQTAGAAIAAQRRIGVYTFKGGVGKSKLALVLAGALAFRDRNVFIVDLNRAQNLQRLVGAEGIYVARGKGAGGTVSVLGRDEWKYGPVLDADYVIYDCPQFFEKTAERGFLPHLNLVVSPIELNADGIGANHHVLRDTVSEVRKDNPHVPIAFVVNNARSEHLQGPMKRFLATAPDLFDEGQQVYLLPLDQFAIPYHPTLEALGQQRALDPRSHVELVFSRANVLDAPWLRPALRLADLINGGYFWPRDEG
jgi:hypothetical protein